MVDWEDNNTTVVDCPMKDGKDRDWEDERKKTAVGNTVAERKRSVVAMGDGRETIGPRKP